MSSTTSSSEAVPGIPASFLASQKCPLGLCRFPDTPLPPPSPIILAALNKCCFAELRQAQRALVVIDLDKYGAALIHARIVELASSGVSPDEILDRINSGVERKRLLQEGRDELLGRMERRSLTAPATALGMAEFWKTINSNLVRMINERSHTTSVTFSEAFCLHDVLDVANLDEWIALLDVDQVFSDRSLNGMEDLGPFLRVLDTAIGERKVLGKGWECPLIWRSKIREASKQWEQVMIDVVFELGRAADYEVFMKMALVDVGSTLPLLAHFLFAPADADLPYQFAMNSCDIIVLARTAGDLHEERLASPVLSAQWAQTSRRAHELFSPLSVHSASTSSSSPSFRRTQRAPNISKMSSLTQRRVEPRCCPPDRCSGKPPSSITDVSAPDYARVEKAIVALFEYWFRQVCSDNLDISEWISKACIVVLGETKSFACTESEARFNLLSRMENAMDGMMDDEWEKEGPAILRDALNQIRGQLRSLRTGGRRFPCLCDLVRSVDKLERIVTETTTALQSKISTTSSTNDTMRWITKQRAAENLQDGCWREGRGWNEKCAPFIRFMEKHFRAVMETSEYQNRLPERYLDHFRLFGSARIFEESLEADSYDPLKSSSSPTSQVIIFLEMASTSQQWSTDPPTHHFRQTANKHVGAREFERAICAYKGCLTLSTTGSWIVRLNSAAVRLQLADSDSQFHQYSLAIQDCTMALYYCPSEFKFKGFYRRGAALAHLKLWKKAIADFKEALRIEPHNVLIKRELAAAKKQL